MRARAGVYNPFACNAGFLFRQDARYNNIPNVVMQCCIGVLQPRRGRRRVNVFTKSRIFGVRNARGDVTNDTR